MQTLTEKIISNYIDKKSFKDSVKQGSAYWIEPEHVMSHDNSAAIINKFNDFNIKKVINEKQPIIALDHNIQDKSIGNKKKYSRIEVFSQNNNITFFSSGKGIGHQIMVEEGFAFPGTFCVASDSHANMYGGVGCLGTPVVRTDAAAIWATGKIWWRIPKIINVVFNNRLREGVTGKDVILTLINQVGRNVVLNSAIEFTGEGINSLSIDDRLTIANMTTEWGALSGLFPIDIILIEWLKKHSRKNKNFNKNKINSLIKNPLIADSNANYFKTINVDLNTINPFISGANDWASKSLTNEKIFIDKAYLVSCANSRESDLKKAANILSKGEIHPNVKMYLSPASNQVQKQLEQDGVWKVFLDAGVNILPSGCGPCIGLGEGIIKKNEVAISSSNRNAPGRMGHKDGKVYLSSPETVVKSAIKGYISHDENFEIKPDISIVDNNQIDDKSKINSSDLDIPMITGEGIYCFEDNITTDGIFPSSHTYNENLSDLELAELSMKNYDDNFFKLSKKGDILLSGYNFGIGSSREQAVTCLKARGIKLVIAASYSSTYMRNALNNGYGLIECPSLINKLKTIFSKPKKSIRLNSIIKIDFKNSKIHTDLFDCSFSFKKWNNLEYELISSGGLKNFIIKERDKK